MDLRLPDDCTACTSCVTACPVAEVTARFRGPKLAGPALERFRLLRDDVDPTLELCSGCRSCDAACPSGVPVSTLNLRARAHQRRRHPLRDRLLAHPDRLARLASPVASLANAALSCSLGRTALRGLGVGGGTPLPRYARTRFTAQLRALAPPRRAEQVVLFPGCYVEWNAPEVGLDFVAVMQAAGVQVVVPEGLGCCGAPLVASAFLDDAAAAARRQVAALLPLVRQGLRVVTLCTSCGLALAREYPELLGVEGGAELARSLCDATDLVLELLEAGRLRTPGVPPARVLYHAPCHLRASGSGLPGVELLRAVPGLEVVEADAGCCGMAGSYGFKTEKRDVAAQVGRRLFERVGAVRPSAVASECGTCRLQIAHRTGARTVHPITLLRQALREPDPVALPQVRAVHLEPG